MIRILVADDHPIVRSGLKQIISDTADMVVVGEAGTYQQVLDAVRQGGIDVVLLDIAMPGKDGIETLKQVKQEFPKLSVLILSMYPEEQYAIRALKSQASGYVTKASAPEELISALRTVARGGRYVSKSLAEKLVHHLQGAAPLPHEQLSDREYQVFIMIAQGKSVSDIADSLHLSVKTISTNRTRILSKMALKNNAELMHYAARQGLLL